MEKRDPTQNLKNIENLQKRYQANINAQNRRLQLWQQQLDNQVQIVQESRATFEAAYNKKKKYVPHRNAMIAAIEQLKKLREEYQRRVNLHEQVQQNIQNDIKRQNQIVNEIDYHNSQYYARQQRLQEQQRKIQNRREQRQLEQEEQKVQNMESGIRAGDVSKKVQVQKQPKRTDWQRVLSEHLQREQRQEKLNEDFKIKTKKQKEQEQKKEVQKAIDLGNINQRTELDSWKVYHDKFRRFSEDRYRSNAQNLRQLYQEIMRQGYNPRNTRVVLNNQSNDRQKNGYITISGFRSFEEFEERLQDVFSSEEWGSGLTEKGMDNINYGFFGFRQFNIEVPHSKQPKGFKPIFYYEESSNGYENMCLLNCFDSNGIDCKKYVKYYEQNDFTYTIKTIVRDNPDISVYVAHNEYSKILEDTKRAEIRVMKTDEKNGHLVQGKKKFDYFYPIILQNKVLQYTNKDSTRDIYLLLDLKSNHIEVLSEKSIDKKNKIVFNDTDFYRSQNGQILQLNQEKLSVKDSFKTVAQNIQSNFEDKHDFCMFSFDYETVFEPQDKNMLKEYSVSYFYRAKNSYISGCFYGFNCSQKLMEVVQKLQDDSIIIMLGFNNSKFDNFCLLNELVKQDMLSNIKFQGNQIMKLEFNKRHFTYDLCKILMSSLSQCCKDFGIQNAKREFDHNIVQQVYLDGQMSTYFGFDEYTYQNEQKITKDKKGKEIPFNFKKVEESIDSLMINRNLRDLIKYNIMDCVALFDLYHKVDNIFKEKKITEKDLYEYKTIASIPHKNFKKDKLFYKDEKDLQKMTKNKDERSKTTDRNGGLNNEMALESKDKIKIQLPKLQHFLACKEAIIAGRTECFELKQFLKGETFVSMDVASLYPYVMMYYNKYYGIGNILDLSFEECQQRELIGFYKVTFNQENLRYIIIAMKKKNGLLDWKYKGTQTRYLSTIDINQLLKHGCHVTIEKNEDGTDIGFCREGKILGKDLFKWLDDIASQKTEQDKLKEEKSKDYNASYRGLCKLLLNSQSGKFLFSKFIDQTEYITKAEEQEDKILQKHNLDELEMVHKISDQKYIVKYKADLETQLNNKSNNLCIDIGVCIYSYAREYMYNTIISKFNQHTEFDLYYGDTDSLTMKKTTWEFLREKYPEIQDFNHKKEQDKKYVKQFGEFECEFESNEINIFAPKNYFFFKKTDDKIKLKGGFKGIKITRDVYIEKDMLPTVLQMDQQQLFEFYKQQKNKLMLNEYSSDSKIITEETYNKLQKFIAGVINNENQFILCSSLKKQICDVQNSNVQGCAVGQKSGMKLYQCYQIKEICLSNVKVLPQIKKDLKMIKKGLQSYFCEMKY